MVMPGARFSRDHVSRGHGAPMQTVSRRTQPVNRNIHHAQSRVGRSREGGGAREVKSRPPATDPESPEPPPPRSGSHPGPRGADPRGRHAGGTQSREPDNEDAATRRFLPRWRRRWQREPPLQPWPLPPPPSTPRSPLTFRGSP